MSNVRHHVHQISDQEHFSLRSTNIGGKVLHSCIVALTVSGALLACAQTFSNQEEFSQFVQSLDLPGRTLDDAVARLTKLGFGCYDIQNLGAPSKRCSKQTKGLPCAQKQIVQLELADAALIVKSASPSLMEICL
jgi:hypothetical protein